MQRSFMPRQAAFRDGVARLPLPGEARAMRDRRWYCLVRAAGQVALCKGELPPEMLREDQSATVALFGGPLEPSVGRTSTISGFVPLDDGAAREAGSGAYELTVVDAMEQIQLRRGLELSRSGTFDVDVPVANEHAGKHLRFILRRDEQIVKNVLPRLALAVPRLDERRFRVQVDVPAWVQRDEPVPVSVRAEFPWGVCSTQPRIDTWFVLHPLPWTGRNQPPSVFSMELDRGALNGDGVRAFELPPLHAVEAQGPLAVRVHAHVRSWEGRQGVGRGEFICGPRAAWAWILPDPPQPHVGQEVRLRLGWFQPGGRAVLQPPTVELRSVDDDSSAVRLATYRRGGRLTSEPWRPQRPGTYEALAVVDGFEDPPLQARRTIEVGPAPIREGTSTPRPSGRAHLATRKGVRGVQVELRGASATPLLVVADADDPVAARALPALDGAADLHVPVESGPTPSRILVFGLGEHGPELVLARSVEVGPHPGRGELLPAGPLDVLPGTTATVSVARPPPFASDAAATLFARLVDGRDDASADLRLTAPGTDDEAAPTRVQVVASSGKPVADRAALRERGFIEPALRAVLTEGATRWSACVPATSDECDLAVAVPAVPGLYKLVVGLRTRDGLVTTDAVMLDARRGAQAELLGPRRLTRGDRANFAIRLINGSGREQTPVSVWLEADSGVLLRAIGIDDGPLRAGEATLGDPLRVVVPPGGVARLHAEVEAVRAGPARIYARVLAEGHEVSLARTCDVTPAIEPPPASPVVNVERIVLLWSNQREPAALAPLAGPAASLSEFYEGHEHHDHEHDPADLEARVSVMPQDLENWAPLGAAERLVPGQYLLVREIIRVSESRSDVIWTQPLPAGCLSVATPPKEFQRIGPRKGGLPDSLTLQVDELNAGTHWNEYPLAVVRSGEFSFPVPRVRSGQDPVPVAVEPADLRLTIGTKR
jgi:hypothetical protein